MRLLLDEMHSPTIGGALSEKGIDVIAVAGEPSLRGLSDADLLDHAAATDRVLVTENLDDLFQGFSGHMRSGSGPGRAAVWFGCARRPR